MIFRKKNTFWSLLQVSVRLSPWRSAITAIQKIVDSAIPAATVLAISYFINTALSIFAGELAISNIYRP